MAKLAVIGHPVAHSRSPAIQNAALGALGLENWSYRAIDAAPGAFEMTVRELASVGYAGVNVTVPHKQAALALADEASEASQQIGAANTLVFDGKRIEAHNTDADGLLASLPDSPRGRRRRPGGDLGAAVGRGRGRGLEPHGGEGGGSLRRAGRGGDHRSPAGRLRDHHQHQCCRVEGGGSVRAPAAGAGPVRREPDGRRHGLRGSP
jgi:hypothetical protein